MMTTLMLPLTGCINDSSICPDEVGPETEKGVTFEFSVVTRKADSTRALLSPTGTPMPGSAAENYLDMNNLLFLLFDDDPSDPVLVQVFKPTVEAEDIDTYVKYKVKAFFNDFTFFQTDDPTLTFSIMVIANYMGLSPNDFGYHKGQTMSQIFNQSRVGTFATPVRNNERNWWIPSIGSGNYTDAFNQPVTGMIPAHIPMAGLQTFTIDTEKLNKSTVDSPLQLSPDESKEINMLRALAKIEVVDRIGVIGTENERSWIEKVELMGFTTRGSIVPNLDDWKRSGVETQYVRTPSIPNAAGFVGARPNESLVIDLSDYSSVINFFPDRIATNDRGDNYRVFSCYLTEYNPVASLLLEQYPMWMRVTANSPGLVAEDGSSSTFYRLEVAPYGDNGEPGQPMQILRNNIYRYEVTGITTSLDLRLQVSPWTTDEIMWDYSDNPGFADGGHMDWISGATNVDSNSATIYLRSQNSTLTGVFTFAQPLDGTWTAVFAPGPNTETDAFVFVDAEGKELPGNTASGIIDGQPSTIRIKTKYEQLPSDDRSVRLIFSVLTPDGRTISANVLGPEWGNNNTYFTIIQQAAL